MAQRIFVKVVGFSDEERHALNTVFRLSEQCQTMYQHWSPESPEAAQLGLLDGQSYEGQLEAELPQNEGLKMLWIGDDPPPQVWRSFQRPIAWPEVVQAMDVLFMPPDIDFDLDIGQDADTVPGGDTGPMLMDKRALIVSASRDVRLYLRARLSLSKLTQADDAETGAQALELVRAHQYDVALVDLPLPDMDGWQLLRQLKQGKKPIRSVGLTKARRSLPEHVRAWLGGAPLMDNPPNPVRLENLLKRV
jgi:CheY-like chemotaxis protein